MNKEQTGYDYINLKLKQAGWDSGDIRVLTEYKIITREYLKI